MFKLFLLSIGILIFAMGIMAIKLFFDSNAKFTGGTCASKSSEALKNKGVTCNCSSNETTSCSTK